MYIAKGLFILTILVLTGLLFIAPSSSMAATCNETATPGEDFDSLNSRVDSGELICLPPGTYNWGSQISLSKANVDWYGSGKDTVINTSIDITADDVTLYNFALRANFDSGSSGVIKPLGDRFIIVRLDISSDNNSKQGIQIGGSGGTPEDGILVLNKIHHNGADGQFDHGVYCNKARNTFFAFNWIYRNSSYGIQFYPDCDNSDFVANIVANNGIPSNNGRGIVFGSEGSSISSDNVVRHSIIASYASNDSRAMVRCNQTVPGSTLTDSIIKPASLDSSITDCGSQLTQARNVVEEPGFINQAEDDYRTSPTAYVPGPRP